MNNASHLDLPASQALACLDLPWPGERENGGGFSIAMRPRLAHIEAFHVAGLSLNASHGESETRVARTFNLWCEFFERRIYRQLGHRSTDRRLFGVFRGNGLSLSGGASVTVGCAVTSPQQGVRIEAGRYLIFSGSGKMPALTQLLWTSVRHYFSCHPDLRRRWRSDFEAFTGPDEVAIHVGVV